MGAGASCLIHGFNPISDQLVGLNTVVSTAITRDILAEELPNAYRDQVDASQPFTKVELQSRSEYRETFQETIYLEGDYDREQLASCFTPISELDVSKLPEIVARALQYVQFSSSTTITSSPTTTVQTTPTTTVTTSQTTSKTSTPTTTVQTTPTTTVTTSQTTSKTTTQTTTVSTSPTTSASSSPSKTITTSPTTSKTTTQTSSVSSSQTSTATTTKSTTFTTTVTRTQTSTPSTSQTSTQSTSPSSTATSTPTTTVTTTVTKTVTTTVTTTVTKTVTTTHTSTPSSTQIVSEDSSSDPDKLALLVSLTVVSLAMCILFMIWKMNKSREIGTVDPELESGVDLDRDSEWVQTVEALDSQEISSQNPNEEPGFIEKKRLDSVRDQIVGPWFEESVV